MCLQREHLARTSSDLVLFFLEDNDIARFKCWLRFGFVFFWSESFVFMKKGEAKHFTGRQQSNTKYGGKHKPIK